MGKCCFHFNQWLGIGVVLAVIGGLFYQCWIEGASVLQDENGNIVTSEVQGVFLSVCVYEDDICMSDHFIPFLQLSQKIFIHQDIRIY
ncbi:hypothetical protein KIPB_000972 [Kipferlia bialata]|uniref:Uncharacterized protein n=1 Tax=Kipferlia bialata TaxID=797122 RepID=A0A391NJ74_9EUKA|nr:hypothetical protein KIPB_000972 [Kipferlia bialata]|eukprot:g972.t1